MRFTLKDYQDDAVTGVLDRLKDARESWQSKHRRTAFSLTAATGAGKTVMAAAIFEALFYGNDEYGNFQPDPGAVVIWFSDDPSLNEQSRQRLQQASDKLKPSDLIPIETTFARERFEAGKVYFLNTHKLAKNSMLVRGHDVSDGMVEKDDRQLPIMPDLRSHTIWNTIRNTIEDPSLSLYLVLDEAHRGMQESRRTLDEKPTIVKQLINGSGTVPAIPIVWGISATVKRFNDAIAGMQDRWMMPSVVVSPVKVQASGLLKDTINLDVPKDDKDYTTLLLRRATDKLRELSGSWHEYSLAQGSTRDVVPLLVFQVPKLPNPAIVGTWLDAIFERWPELPLDCIANVFGEHRTEQFGRHTVPYVSPERVQDATRVRILVAKDAISTGWDCPRAEVMISLRRAENTDYITQLLGRMLRTPLARRIPGNERLNAVDCILPYFDKNSLKLVVEALLKDSDSGEELPGRRVLINPQEMKPNAALPEEVWQALVSLPSQTLPKRQARPVRRLTALAHEIATDGLLPDAGKIAHAEMHKVLDGARVQYAEQIASARDLVLTFEGTRATTDVATGGMTFNDFVEMADYAVIEEAYKSAARVISPALAKTYTEHLAGRVCGGEDPEDALIEAHTVVAALVLVTGVRESLDREAKKLGDQWLQQFRISIKGLADERKDVYRQIREMSADPLDNDLARPTLWLQPTISRGADGTEVNLFRFERHFLCDGNGLFPDDFNSWEEQVVLTELDRAGTIAWYRNPSRTSQDSLGVSYSDAGVTKILRPDFIFFGKRPDGTISIDIVDPHGFHLADGLPKLRGLARYAETYTALYRRVESVALVNGKARVLDLKEARVRSAVNKAESTLSLYESDVAGDY